MRGRTTVAATCSRTVSNKGNCTSQHQRSPLRVTVPDSALAQLCSDRVDPKNGSLTQFCPRTGKPARRWISCRCLACSLLISLLHCMCSLFDDWCNTPKDKQLCTGASSTHVVVADCYVFCRYFFCNLSPWAWKLPSQHRNRPVATTGH